MFCIGDACDNFRFISKGIATPAYAGAGFLAMTVNWMK